MGFDTPTPVRGSAAPVEGDAPAPPAVSQAGGLAPAGAVGHLGYTGCSLWIDLVREVAVVLLTNRVVFGTGNRKLSALRPRIHDAVWKEVAG
jgi:CubicO group peptidase (beta-lactamase class C family)